MASIIDHQYTHVGSNGVTDSGGSISRKIPGVAKRPVVNRPPSPPTTDTETDTEIPVNNTVSAPSGRQGLESQPRSTPTLTATIGNLVTAAAALDINSISNSNPNPEPQTITADGAIEASEIAAPSTPDTPSVTSPITSPITSPPYWNFDGGQHGSSSQHSRSVSSASVESLPRGGIILRDNENSSLDERGSACWARSVRVTDWTVVNGSTTGIGAFVVFNIQVETLNGSHMNIRKRYSEFDEFRWRLMRTFPGFEAAVPELPPKSIISKFRPRFLEKRRAGLQYFLNCILLNPEFSGSPVLKEFLFS